jgi:chromosome segregation ATPase
LPDVRNQVKAEADGEIHRLNERLQEFEKTHNEVVNEWKGRSDDWINREKANMETMKQLSNDKDHLHQQLSQTTAALSMLIEDKNKIQKEFDAAIRELGQVKSSYQQELDSKIGNTVSELQTERSILATIRKKLTEKEEQTVHLMNQVQQMENQLHQFQQQIEMYEQQRAELSGQVQIRDSRIASLEHQEKQLLDERNRLLENIAQKQQQLAVVTNQFEGASLACSEVSLILILIHGKHVYP